MKVPAIQQLMKEERRQAALQAKRAAAAAAARAAESESETDSQGEQSSAGGSSAGSPKRLSPERAVRFGLLPDNKPAALEYTVVFDMDETLLWHPLPGRVFRRPYLRYLLESLRGKCEIVLWTASTEALGRLAVEQVDPNGRYFNHVIYRHKSWFKDGKGKVYVKDLELLGRDVSKVIMIENTPNSIRFHKENAVIVPDYESQDDPQDVALKLMTKLLTDMIGSGGLAVPQFLRRHPLAQEVALCRKDAKGKVQMKKKPGVFYYLKLN